MATQYLIGQGLLPHAILFIMTPSNTLFFLGLLYLTLVVLSVGVVYCIHHTWERPQWKKCLSMLATAGLLTCLGAAVITVYYLIKTDAIMVSQFHDSFLHQHL